MGIVEKKGVKVFQFESFKNLNIKHCFTTRVGGVSTGCYDSLNLAFKGGDNRENVYKNYEILANAFNFTYLNAVISNQVHDIKVKCVTKEDIGKGLHRQSDIIGIDGLVTIEKNIPLYTYYADCVPVFFVDSKTKAVGVSHAGWKGTLNNIVKETVNLMKKEYNTKPEDLYVGIGPSIHSCCFEVDEDVYIPFKENLKNHNDFITKKGEKYHIDLQSINKYHLQNLGVKNIEIAPYCTKCNSELFYSHRQQGVKRGTMSGIIERY